jgi:putative membrane protein insertion efficiency factor
MFNKNLAKIKLKLILIPKKIALTLIAIYRLLISPFLKQSCRFYPSCSQYAQTAIQRFGLIYGGWLTLKRLLRCHPFNPGGIDEVPNKFGE